MIEAAQKLIDVIKDSLPLSIQDNVEIGYTKPIQTNEGWRVEINFDTESIFRKSLLNDGDSGYGITNIVALLNNGYHARKQVYGYWDTAGRKIWSRQDREALGFMQEAINTFNNNIGSHYNCTAELSNVYKKK